MEDIIDNDGLAAKLIDPDRRRKLLPWWIKVFIWIFIVFSAVVPIGLVAGILGYAVPSELYGLKTDSPYSVVGIVVYSIFLFKGVTAYGLWTQKDWALTIAQIDAIIGTIICLFVSLGMPMIGGNSIEFSFRLEFLFLIPYLIKIRSLLKEW